MTIHVLPALLLLCVASSCESNPQPHYELKKLYTYRVVVQTAGTEYQLRKKYWRFRQFRHTNAPGNTAMFAYRISRYGDPFASPSNQLDTVEVAVTSAQADRLFALSKAYIERFTLTDIDTVSERVEHIQTEDYAGRIMLEVQGQQVTAEVSSLHASSLARQSAAFFLVEESFARLFPKLN